MPALIDQPTTRREKLPEPVIVATRRLCVPKTLSVSMTRWNRLS
jgi:hypothetical protein